MANINFNKVLIFIVLSLLVNRVVIGQQFRPTPRIAHTATFLGGKIYFIGGASLQLDRTASDFFYLSLEKNFSWVDLKSQGVKFPYTAWHTCDIGGANQDSIFIIGGRRLETTSSLVYKFDTKTNVINPPIIQGKIPPPREAMSSVSYGGKIYIFSGASQGVNNSPIWFNNFDILDTVNLNWLAGSLVNAPLPRIYYTATLVNGIIYYIGGMQQGSHVPMANISQYDIIGDTWSLQVTTGVIPETRTGHSAILVNGNIYIYGGIGQNNLPSIQQFVILNTNTLVWSIPQFQPSNIPSLTHHTATSIGGIMLIAFGNVTDTSGRMTLNDKYYQFDLSKTMITWNFYADLVPQSPPSQPPPPPPPQSPKQSTPTPTPTVSTTTSPTDSTSPSTGVVVGLSVGLVAVGIAGIVAFSLVYRYKKKNKENENDRQIPPGDDIHYQQYTPQFAPSQNAHYSASTLTQSFNPALPHSQHTSIYSPGSETPPPPPPKTPPYSVYGTSGTNQQPYY